MNPTRARQLADKYRTVRQIPDPSPETVEEIGRTWTALRQELLHQTGRTDRRDYRSFGDPAAVYERRAS